MKNFSQQRKLYLLSAGVCLALISTMTLYGSSVQAMDLKTALEITLHTNPDIAESAANRRAIDFEYEQARRLNGPAVIIEGRAGPEWVDSRTTRLLGNDEDVLFGRQASVTIEQNLMSFGRHNSERDRQASRIDAAAHRVKERSELISLDVVQSYFDIMRLRDVINFADRNVAFHESKTSEISQSVSGGVRSQADAQQSRERLSAALVSRNETEEALSIAESNFMRLVGREIGMTEQPSSVAASLPQTLAEALQQARQNNPTLKISNADLDTALAEYRKSKADKRPTLKMEVSGRAGDNIAGFRDTSNDVRAQLVFRHEFRGGIKSSAVQEHLNRVDEVRQRIMRLERNVDGLVREAWATRNSTRQRKIELAKQVAEGVNLLDSYQREFTVGRRSLLDILDSQSSLFQAQTSLVTAQHADLYAQFRILASTGMLMESLGLSPRREADANLRAYEKVEDTPAAEMEPRRYPNHYSKIAVPSIDSLAEKPGSNVTSVKTLDTYIAKPIKKIQASVPIEKVLSSPTIPHVIPNTVAEQHLVPTTYAKLVTEPVRAKPFAQANPQVAAFINPLPTTGDAATYAAPVVPISVASLDNPTVDTNQNYPSGFAAKTVTHDEFLALKAKQGAQVNWKLKTILLGDTLYMLE